MYGLENSAILKNIDFIPDYPSNIARDLKEGIIDIGLVPVAIIPELKEWNIISDFCIGCDGPVASVCLFSEVEIHQVERVLLDYQSRTSVELAKILLRDYWKISPELIMTTNDYRDSITGVTAGLVIGDRSFEQREISPYIYDLGEAWKMHTGLPFVFATWISNKSLDKEFIEDFNKANLYGINHLSEVLSDSSYSLFDLKSYYVKYISYDLDEKKKSGLKLFLDLMKKSNSNIV